MSDEGCGDGQVLLTIAAPHQTSLTREGEVPFDKNITVDDSWDFGDAEVLGTTKAEQDFLEDKSLYVVKVSSDTYSTTELLSKLDDQAYVVSAEPDYYQEKWSVNDPMSSSQWYLDGTNVTSEGIRYSGLKQSSGTKTPVVAIVDTGIDYTHEDLAAHMWKNTSPALEGIYGYDFGDGDADPMDEDEDGHGTHCAGVIGAATNNKTGISGISSNAKLMALKVFNSSGKAYNSAVIGAFNYIYQAQQLGVNIAAVNCSWGGGKSSSTMKSLIEKIGKAGAVFVFASGNDGVNHDSDKSKECPYDISSPYIVTVGASDTTDARAGYSDYGASTVDLFAPGSQILSTVNAGEFYPALLPATERDALCSYFSSCNTLDKSLFLPAGSVNVSDISHSTEDSLGNRGSGSLRLKISPSSYKDSLLFYIDVTELDLSPDASYYLGYDIGLRENGVLDWEHQSARCSSKNFYDVDDKTYFMILGLSGSFQSVPELYLDNISISTANPSSSSLRKYNVYSGTSMAAPSVSAAVAILASTYTKDNAVQRRERLLTCVRKVSKLSRYCKTGGILDLSRVPAATYTTSSTNNTSTKIKVTKVRLNKKKAT
ncbi:MAG: S8 family serine peptidase, partial [Roseburia sp.]|nr:S8 family serine peptidase [Roseburia sp.]